MAIPACFLVLLLGNIAGVGAVRIVRDIRIRRAGVQVVGQVIHARNSGYVNWVQNWELEVELPSVQTIRLMVLRRFPFTPGEPISLLVDPKHPGHAVLPPRPSADF